MLTGIGIDLNTKPEEVFIVMVLQNSRTIQDCVHYQKLLKKGYLAEASIDKVNEAAKPEMNKQILEGKKASQTICQYVDWLMSTYNPNPPDDGTLIKPSIHPCQRTHHDIVNAGESDDDYVDLLNTVQRHTRCSTNYCLRNQNLNVFEPCQNTRLEFEPIHTRGGNVQYKAKIITEE